MEAPASVRGRLWRSGKLQHDFTFDKISDYLCRAGHVGVGRSVRSRPRQRCPSWPTNWASIAGRSRIRCRPPNASRQRTTSTHTFLTIYASPGRRTGTRATTSQSMLSMRRISAFVLAQALITVRLSPCVRHRPGDAALGRHRRPGVRRRRAGPRVARRRRGQSLRSRGGLDDRLERIIDDELFNAEGVNRRSSASDLPDAQRLGSTTSRRRAHAGRRQLDAASSPRCGDSPVNSTRPTST